MDRRGFLTTAGAALAAGMMPFKGFRPGTETGAKTGPAEH